MECTKRRLNDSTDYGPWLGAMNVLMIAIDDMRPELEPYGQAHMHTPNMQKLAERSTLFSRAYVQVAVIRGRSSHQASFHSRLYGGSLWAQ